MTRIGLFAALLMGLAAADRAEAHHLEPRAPTANTAAVSAVLDGAGLVVGDPLFEVESILDDEALLTPAEFEFGLRSLSGEVIPGLLSSRLLVSRQFDRMLARQLRPIGPERPGVVVGGVNTGGCMFGEAGGCGSDICPYCTAGEGDYGPFFIEPGPSTWVRVNGLDADGDTVPGGPIANDVNAVLYQLGYTFPVDSELLFGAVLGYGDTDIDGDLDLGEFDQRTTRVSFYTRKTVGHVFVTAATSYGYDQTILTRQVVAGPLAIETEAGKFDGHEFSSFVELGANLFESRNVTVQPLIGLRYARVFRDADTELGDAPEALIFDSQSEDALEFRLGGRFAKTFRATKAVELIPEVRAWWLHDFQAEVPETTLRLAGLPDVPFVVRGERPDENVAVVGLGVTVVLDNEYALWFQYDGEYGNQTTTNVASAGFLSSW